MSNRHWVHHPAIGGLIAALIVACVFIAGLEASGPSEGSARQHHASNQAGPATAAPHLNEIPPATADEGADKNYYAREDLRAQQDMSRWAFFQLVISGAGLFLLIRTLNANMEATRAAMRQAEIAETALTERERARMHVNFEISSLDFPESEDDDGVEDSVLTLGFQIQNVGATHAILRGYQVEYWAEE